MATSSITDKFVINDDAVCQRLIDALEEFEAQTSENEEIKSGPSVCERGIELLIARYSR